MCGPDSDALEELFQSTDPLIVAARCKPSSQPLPKLHEGHLLVEAESRHQSRQLALLIKGSVADIDVDQNTVGGGTDAGEEATQGLEAAPEVDALAGGNRKGLAGPNGGEGVGGLGVVFEEDVECLW